MKRWLLLSACALVTTWATAVGSCQPGEDIMIKKDGTCEVRCHCMWTGDWKCTEYRC